MKIVLATGIYPPEIGGPATYVKHLAEELTKGGHKVTVICYGKDESDSDFPVISISRAGGPLIRWWRYSRALKKHGKEADSSTGSEETIVYAFSSVSVGMPLILARLKGPKKILRLGGDFFWERYTDRGGKLDLHDWSRKSSFFKKLTQWILQYFDHLVFSTQFQKSIYQAVYRRLPASMVIENALPANTPTLHSSHTPFRLLFMGRFVPFKNLENLLLAMVKMPTVRLTLIGSGPQEKFLKKLTTELKLGKRVLFLPPVSGDQKTQVYRDYDLLIIPSLTEISPNTALEARSHGLPVLLSAVTGLSDTLTTGMCLEPLRIPVEIVKAVSQAQADYEELALGAMKLPPERNWATLTAEHISYFKKLT